MRLFHNYHHNKLYKNLHSDLALFDLSIWLHVFARSMIAVFIPIFLLKVGYSITWVMIYYCIYHVLDVPMNFVARWLIKVIGAKKVIIWSIFALIGFFITLYNLHSEYWQLLIILALFSAIYDSLYWVAHIFLFINCSDNTENMSKKTSLFIILKRIAGILAPLIGAVILIISNQHVLIIFSILMLIASLVPLFKIKNIKDKPVAEGKLFVSWDIIKDYISLGLRGIHNTAEYVIWPIFIFIIFGTLNSVAILPIIVSITAIIFTYLTGKRDKGDRGKMIVLGSGLIIITWILRIFIAHTLFYYFSVFLMGLFIILVTLPMESNIYEKGDRLNPLAVATYRNASSMTAPIIIFGFLIFMTEVFHFSFVSAALAMFILLLINLFVGGAEKKQTNQCEK